MSDQEDPEVRGAFDAIRKLFAGELVPPPPRYFNDPGKELDVMRAVGWVAHALFEPDVDGDNVLSTVFYNPEFEDTIAIPGQMFSWEDMTITSKGWEMEKVLSAMGTSYKVLKGEGRPVDEKTFEPLKNQSMADSIIGMIQKHLDDRGRLSNEGGWPAVDEQDVMRAQRIMSTLVTTATGGVMSVAAYSRLEPFSIISYPVAGNDEKHVRMAEQALSQMASSVDGVANSYGNLRSEKLRRERAAEEKGKLMQRMKDTRIDVLARHEDLLLNLGTNASLAIQRHLVGVRKVPVYKGTLRFPTPEKDALIDEIHEFLGGDAHETLALLISDQPERNIEGLKRLDELLTHALENEGPSPS